MLNFNCTQDKREVIKVIVKICTLLTNKIQKEMPEVDNERAEIIMYGLQNIIGEFPKGIIILILAYLFGIFKITLLSLLIIPLV